ncbi:hypothetical protein C9439_06130 [archaeon SCG-AAA382B04]|nr:hypothetical protein C9439_06130 [archaeon SCG-AAA382B04]
MDEEKIKKVLNEKIAPKLQVDGGDLEFVGIEDDKVKIKLKGACAGCPMSQITMSSTVEQHLKAVVPEVEEVEAI